MSKESLIEGIAENVLVMLPKAKAVFKDTYARRPQLKLRGIQVVILDLISQEGAMSMGQLSSRVAIAKANTTPLVADLIEKGLLLRRRYEKDRRVVLIDLTEEGRALHRQIHEENMALFKEKLCTLDDGTLCKLDEVVRSLTGVLDHWLSLP
ncbi:MAG: MarR family transcriptional regulator [Clostridiales bacterium]|nr:MarR family transcriptional regulator [Clostridiales bacterium]